MIASHSVKWLTCVEGLVDRGVHAGHNLQCVDPKRSRKKRRSVALSNTDGASGMSKQTSSCALVDPHNS